MSSVRSTAFFICNQIGRLVLGNEAAYSFGLAVFGIVLNMLPIIVFDVIWYKNQTNSLNSLIIGSTLTSILAYFQFTLFLPKRTQAYYKPFIFICLECLFCALLALLHSYVDFSTINVSIFIGTDLGIYCFFKCFKEICKGWSFFGLNLNLTCIKYTYLAIA